MVLAPRAPVVKRARRQWRVPSREKVRATVHRIFRQEGGREIAELRVEDAMLEFVEGALRVPAQSGADRAEFRRLYGVVIRALSAELLEKDAERRAEEERLRGTLDRFTKPLGSDLHAGNNYTLAPDQVLKGRCKARIWNNNEREPRPLRQCLYFRQRDSDLCARHCGLKTLPYGRVDEDLSLIHI